MIYPTPRAVLIAAAVAPLALIGGVVAPGAWLVGLAGIVLLIALMAFDALAGAPLRAASGEVAGPRAAGVGVPALLTARVRFAGRAPGEAELAFDLAGPVEMEAGVRRAVALDADGTGSAAVALRAARRGTAALERMWLRWRGPLGLVWKQKELPVGRSLAVTPDVSTLRSGGIRFLNRDAGVGQTLQLQRGEGSEFDALTEYRQGMDRRAIDWKQSARHTALIAKEYRTERNNNIVMALDCGRVMAEPVGGVPRIDRAISAALLTGFAALKEGDRVGLFAFDNRPRANTRPVSGARSFALLQEAAAGIDYSAAETNYTLALSTLAGGLRRRSLIVVFTEFADTISAELMLQAVGPLLKRHLVLFVVLHDAELDGFVAAAPEEPDDIGRAVTAAALLRERRLVLTRLRHLGVQVVESAPEQAGPALLNAYLGLKRRNLL